MSLNKYEIEIIDYIILHKLKKLLLHNIVTKDEREVSVIIDFNIDITHTIVNKIKGFVNNQLDLSDAVKNKNYHMKSIINDPIKNIEYETQVFLLIATYLDEDSSNHLINKGIVFSDEYNEKRKITSVHFLIREK